MLRIVSKARCGVDGLGAIAGEQREMMHLARLAGLHDEADRRAQAGADQMVVHGRRRQQSRDRDAIRSRRDGPTG